MGRLHLFEFGDFSWFPRVLHDGMRAYLQRAEQMLDLSPFAEKLQTLLAQTGEKQIVDLGSGGTGPLLQILPRLQQGRPDVEIRMTDLYPSALGMAKVEALGVPAVSYEKRPVDAMNPPADLKGVRTIFEAFHHFRPAEATHILEAAFRDRAPIGIFEITPRSVPTILTTVLIPLMVLALTPFIRPLRWPQVVFTYLLPILPLVIFWDGLVSYLRVYSTDELRELTSDMQAPDYTWEIGELRIKGLPVGVPYLIGRPV